MPASRMANTFLATAAAGFSWMLVEWITKGKPSLLGICSGIVAGLVAVTPAAGFAGPDRRDHPRPRRLAGLPLLLLRREEHARL